MILELIRFKLMTLDPEWVLSSNNNIIIHTCIYIIIIFCIGVYLSLKGSVYANNSVIIITEIGAESDPDTATNEALQCITDRRPCCRTHPASSFLLLYIE